MRRKIAVFTGTRADYGLLKGLMRRIQIDDNLDLQVIAAAGHFSSKLGETWREIIQDGFSFDAQIEMLMASNTPTGVARSMGLGVLAMTDALDRLRPDVLVILGDRFEALVAAQVALVLDIPIAHIHGGELTEGVMDDAIRHAITKMAYLHFVAADQYAARVKQMGAPANRVFTVGAPGLDTRSDSPKSLREVQEHFGFSLETPYILATYHPATATLENPTQTVKCMLECLSNITSHQIVLTFANADQGGDAINAQLQKLAAQQPNRILAVPSLGFELYQAVLAQADVVVGNSSSGIIEAPALGVPTVNIGMRQAGRLMAESINTVLPNRKAIEAGTKWALSEAGRRKASNSTSLYGQGTSAQTMVEILRTYPLDGGLPFCSFNFEAKPR